MLTSQQRTNVVGGVGDGSVSDVDAEIQEIERQIAALAAAGSSSSSRAPTVQQTQQQQSSSHYYVDDTTDPSALSADELQRQIDELQRQLGISDDTTVPVKSINSNSNSNSNGNSNSSASSNKSCVQQRYQQQQEREQQQARLLKSSFTGKSIGVNGSVGISGSSLLSTNSMLYSNALLTSDDNPDDAPPTQPQRMVSMDIMTMPPLTSGTSGFSSSSSRNNNNNNLSSSLKSYGSLIEETTTSDSPTSSPTKQQQQSQQYEQEPVKCKTVNAHKWDKPAWAVAPVDSIPDNQAIISESINLGLKKPNTGGYERKVFEKKLEIVPGTFKKPTLHNEKLPPPCLVWIVINLNGCKIGKVVMHLYGNFMDIVDKFLELKGLELKYKLNGNNPIQYYIDDIQPNFYIRTDDPKNYSTTGSSASICYGHVQEGQDIIDTITKSIRSNSGTDVLTIKQSHIYPIKKTKM